MTITIGISAMKKTTLSIHTVAVNSAGGGLAPQYRVQFQLSHQHAWQMYHVYRCRKQAEGCIEMLKQRGLHARMVQYDLCPVAA